VTAMARRCCLSSLRVQTVLCRSHDSPSLAKVEGLVECAGFADGRSCAFGELCVRRCCFPRLPCCGAFSWCGIALCVLGLGSARRIRQVQGPFVGRYVVASGRATRRQGFVWGVGGGVAAVLLWGLWWWACFGMFAQVRVGLLFGFCGGFESGLRSDMVNAGSFGGSSL